MAYVALQPVNRPIGRQENPNASQRPYYQPTPTPRAISRTVKDDHNAQSSERLLGSNLDRGYPMYEDGAHKERRSVLKEKTWKQKHLSGRTVSLRFLATCVALMLVINICVFIYGWKRGTLGSAAFTIAKGPCAKIKKLDLVFHAIINVLGIIALAAVGSFLTALSSPTRQDMDHAHAQGFWFDIGVPSIRNLNHIGRVRKWLSIVLFIFSLPIHIMYNSVLYVNTTTTQFYWLLVTEDFLTGARYNISSIPPKFVSLQDQETLSLATNKIHDMQILASNYSVLDRKDCPKIYSNIYVSTYSDVIMVSSDRNVSNSVLAWDVSRNDNSAWLCAPDRSWSVSDTICDLKALENDPTTWASFGHPIRSCLAQPVNLECSLNLDVFLMAIMLACNVVLLAVMLLTLTQMWSVIRRTLACFGDVLASYLEAPDEHSRGMCLAEKSQINHSWYSQGQPKMLRSNPRRWYNAMSRGRLHALILLLPGGFAVVVAVVIYTLYIVHSDRGLSISFSGLRKLGFGSTTISSDLDMNATGSVTSLAVQANIPQIFLAIVTLVTNAALVEMTQAAEYAQFSVSPKTLRVSEPTGSQRGTHLFSMPYKFAAPVQAITAALHWCISQSIIPVQVTALPTDRSSSADNLTNIADIGFSPLAIIASTVMAGTLVIATLVVSSRRFHTLMPLGSACSLALSAAVHPPDVMVDPDAPFKPVQWGATDFRLNSVGHLSFTSSKQLFPIRKDAYYV